MHIDFQNITLSDSDHKTSEINLDYAGFPPFLRGNTPVFSFPNIISENQIHHFEISEILKNQDSISENIFFEQTFHLLKNTKQKLTDISSNAQIYFLCNDFATNKMAYIRALRVAWTLLFSEGKSQLHVAIEVNPNNLQDLMWIVACCPEYIVCSTITPSQIIDNQKYIHPNTIDALGGNPLLEQKTLYYLEHLLEYATDDDKAHFSEL